MLRGLTTAGLGNIQDPIAFMELAAHYDFQSIEVDAEALIQTYGKAYISDKLERYHLQIGAFDLGVNWRGTEEQFRSQLLQLPARAYAQSALGSSTCTTYILPSTDFSPALFALQAATRLRICAELLKPYNIHLALEFVGPHHLRKLHQHPFIYTLEDTLALIDNINMPNVGLLIDAYHCYTTGLHWDRLRQLSPSLIKYVHINDAKPLPIVELLDNDRLYAGEGVIDLLSFITILREIGYDGVVAHEVLTPEVPNSLEEALHRTRLGYDVLFL